MARKPPDLTIFITPTAFSELDEIWDWNAGRYGARHADDYVAFLREETNKLLNAYDKSKPVPSRPKLRFLLIRRNRTGHGHYVVYRVQRNVIQVLHYFHTSQDWQRRLSDDE